uniref:cytochrome P450 2C42-like n=1 Tax=Ciona intestinalis TaxID=7719 RepID=UPI000521CBC8|nr:cytochrome P450 2C42-like [Ciona intestinalis]|eukprot:XP_018669209.2 cytochrome P450 2C42-like [Ciona intestinalis]
MMKYDIKAAAMASVLTVVGDYLNIWSIVLGGSALIFYMWSRKGNLPPGPRGYPILGAMPYLVVHPEKVITKWSREIYGPILSVPLLNRTIIYLNTYEAITEAFSKQGLKLAGRPYMFLFQQISSDLGITMKTYSEHFKVQRQFGMRSLKPSRIESLVIQESRYFIDQLHDQVGKVYDMKTDVYNFTANIICSVVLGKRFDYDDPAFKLILESSEKALGEPEDANLMMAMILIPQLRFLPPFHGANQRFLQNQHRILRMLLGIIEEHQKNFDPNNVEDFIDAYIYEQKFGIGKNTKLFENDQLKVYVRDLFIAGVETTSNTIQWSILALLYNPKYMDLMYNEVYEALGSDGVPCMKDREKMPVTCAFIQEIMRFRTLTPGAAPHSAMEDIKLNGYDIPSGTMVVANLWALHNDPDTWPEPEKFNPHRHIDSDGKFIHSPKILPFSIGPRYCMGEGIAKAEIFIFLTSLLQKFTVSRDPNAVYPEEIEQGIVSAMSCPHRYNIILTAR